MTKPIDEIGQNLLNPTLKALAKAGGTTEHADWMRSPGNAKLLITFINEQDPVFFGPSMPSAMKPLGKGEYLVHVTYATLPSRAALIRKHRGGVSSVFDGRSIQRHALCKSIDETPGSRVMLLKKFSFGTGTRVNIAEMDKLGYRPAIHLEAYEFVTSRFFQQQYFNIVALGSSAMINGNQHVLELARRSEQLILDSALWCDGEWCSDFEFLFVRKDVHK